MKSLCIYLELCIITKVIFIYSNIKTYVVESLSVSSMYKSYDVSNVHVKSLYHQYIQSSQMSNGTVECPSFNTLCFG